MNFRIEKIENPHNHLRIWVKGNGKYSVDIISATIQEYDKYRGNIHYMSNKVWGNYGDKLHNREELYRIANIYGVGDQLVNILNQIDDTIVLTQE